MNPALNVEPDLHTCAAAGCARQIPLHLLMCAPHWRMVPKPIQAEVYRTWRRYSKPSNKSRETRDPSARQAYLKARTQAVEAVRSQEGV